MQGKRAFIGCMVPNKTLMIGILIFTYQQHNTAANDYIVGISDCKFCPTINWLTAVFVALSLRLYFQASVCMSLLCVRPFKNSVRPSSVCTHNVHLIPLSFSSDMGPDPELFGQIGSGKIVPGLFDEKIWIIFAKFTSQNGPIHLWLVLINYIFP